MFKIKNYFSIVSKKKFDVKRLYGNQIIFYNKQYLNLKNTSTTILVFRDNEASPYLKIPFQELKDLPSHYKDIEIIWVDIATKVRAIRVSEKTKDRLQEHGKMGENFDTLLNRLLDKIDKNER